MAGTSYGYSRARRAASATAGWSTTRISLPEARSSGFTSKRYCLQGDKIHINNIQHASLELDS